MKFSKIIIFLSIIILLFVGILFYINMKQIESFDIKNNSEIIISRYNENLEWIKEDPFNKYNITVYNKGNNTNFITHFLI